MSKIYVLGIDGGTFDLINPWVKCSKLPAFEKIMREGVYGELKSTIPSYTPQAWTSFMTGTNPGKHGIFGFSRHPKGRYGIEFINANARMQPALWEIINGYGKSTGIFNVPMTYPPQKVNGFMVSGMDAPRPDESITEPKSLFHEIKKNFGKYVIESDAARLFRAGKLQAAAEELKNLIKMQHQVAKYLYSKDKDNSDFFMSVISSVDRVQHLFWHLMDPQHLLYNEKLATQYGQTIFEIYQIQDEIIADILSSLTKDSIFIIMSDHGAGRNNFHKVISLNNWLLQKGYMVLKSREQTSATREILKNLYIIGRNHLPRQIKGFIHKRMPGIRHRVLSGFNFASVEWKKSRVYADYPFPYLWINLKGREPGGIVEPGQEYEDLRDELILEFKKIIDPDTGKSIAQGVYRCEEIYSGDALKGAPDLIVHFADGYLSTKGVKGISKEITYLGQIGDWEANMYPSGGHRRNGIFLGLGFPFKQNYATEGMDIIDIAPLICYLLGIPIPSHFDGKFFKDLIDPLYLKDHPVTYNNFQDGGSQGRSYNKDEEAIIQKRLQDLGYA